MDPDANSVQIMEFVDSLDEFGRSLVHEHGALIVSRMMQEGYKVDAELQRLLEEKRQRAQEEWLATDFFYHGQQLAKRRPAAVLRVVAGGRKRTFADMLKQYKDAERDMMQWNEGK